MPREARAEYEPGLYHVYARGNRKQDIFVDDRDRRRYLALLAAVIGRTEWMCLSYCLMGNHIHLLVETRQPNLGAGMHRLQGQYAQYFNRRHGLSGHLFQDRYDAVPIGSDPQLWVAAAYVARNPVAAGLCRKATDYLWSSHADVVYGCSPDWLAGDRLVSYFSTAGGSGLERYAAFVALPPLPKEGQSLFKKRARISKEAPRVLAGRSHAVSRS
ncbi:transposase [Solirubrobacter phytolaccae]|uniref:Transposase n=1 Tax=Solirubrobacter phytolaccae TaxID=1404360 RepID=A0A9X3SJF8_9ACTN|nr:transposase [Solirubrobacter phytolaccae]MDA0185222.1 transposase [Solirubrobacter phytolaccae]